MNTSRFDALTRRAASRMSRRAAVRGTGAGLAAMALGAAGAGHRALAQEASPVVDQATGLMLLFVQNAGATTLTPGDGGIHRLTMTEVNAQTLYFSDRPARVAGTMSTEDLVTTWASAFPDSPPNAVLIGHLADGKEAVVVELLEPVYDAAGGTLTYQVQILAGDRIGDRVFEQELVTELDATREYGEAYLFIDDAGDCAACALGFIILGITADCENC